MVTGVHEHWRYSLHVPSQALSILVQSQKTILTLYTCQLRKFPTTKSRPLKPPTSQSPHPPPLPTIQLRPHIQIKTQSTPSPPIKINHILHHRPLTPLHHPIMPIKRPLIPPQPIPPRPRTPSFAIPAKTPQARAIAGRVLLGGETTFPGFYFGPGALVDGVMDGHDSGHVGGVGGVVFALHGFEEHFF